MLGQYLHNTSAVLGQCQRRTRTVPAPPQYNRSTMQSGARSALPPSSILLGKCTLQVRAQTVRHARPALMLLVCPELRPAQRVHARSSCLERGPRNYAWHLSPNCVRECFGPLSLSSLPAALPPNNQLAYARRARPECASRLCVPRLCPQCVCGPPGCAPSASTENAPNLSIGPERAPHSGLLFCREAVHSLMPHEAATLFLF